MVFDNLTILNLFNRTGEVITVEWLDLAMGRIQSKMRLISISKTVLVTMWISSTGEDIQRKAISIKDIISINTAKEQAK